MGGVRLISSICLSNSAIQHRRNVPVTVVMVYFDQVSVIREMGNSE